MLAQATVPPQARAALLDIGTALRELELLGRLASDARAGNVHLPLDELQRCKAATSDCYAQPWPAALASLIDERQNAARHALATAANSMPAPQWPRCADWPHGSALRTARRAASGAHCRYNGMPQKTRSRTQSAMLIAWRAARRAQRQCSPLRMVSN